MNDYEHTKKAARDAGNRDEEYRLGAAELREIKSDIARLEGRLETLMGSDIDRRIEINSLTSVVESIKDHVLRLERMLQKAEDLFETKEGTAPFKKAVTWFVGLVLTGFLSAVAALVYKSTGIK